VQVFPYILRFFAVLLICIGFSANLEPDPDPAFYLNADPDTNPDPGSQTNAVNADPNPGSTLASQKIGF
jgi:hypothetical protein